MACNYIHNGKLYESYQALLDSLTDADVDKLADILFSQESKQDVVFDKITALKTQANLSSSNTQMIDGSPDLEHDDNTFTTQTFIDSQYFVVNGDSPMFRLSTEDYVERMKKRYVEDREMTQESADAWGSLVQSRWNTIAQNALDFHKLILSSPTDDYTEWSRRTAKTAFAGITEQIVEARKDIIRKVTQKNGRDRSGNGGNAGKIITNLNIQADLRNMAEKIFGHIDYLVVRDNGDIEIFNVKTSVEPYSQWAKEKKEKYRYQLALLKQMLAFHGIDSSHIRVNIIPVQIKYNDQFNAIVETLVQDPVAFDTYNLQYTFQKYDDVAAQFIDSNADFSQLNNASLLKVTTQLQHIFPGKDVAAQGIAQTAKEWVRHYWKACKPEVLPNGGYRLTLPDDGTKIEVSDSRSYDRNEEFVQIIQDRLNSEHKPFAGDKSAYFLRTDIENSFRYGFFSPSTQGDRASYYRTQFEKYFEDKKVNQDGTFSYKWELIKSPLLDAANIIALRNKETQQLDVFVISGMDPSTTFSFKNGRENLLGYYLPDLNNENFTLKSNYGNIDAVRALAILNEILPEVGNNVKLGQLRVMGFSNFHRKKGSFYEFSSLLKEWDTIVRVVNKNSNAGIVNNFQEQSIQCIAPEEVLRQTWVEIVEANQGLDLAELKGLKDIIDQKTLVDGSIVDGLMNMQTVEGKIEKLELLVARLQELADERGINYNSPQLLREATHNQDTAVAAIAKLYMTALRALNLYYGDIAIDNEEFSALQEYGMKPSSIGNTSVREVAYLTQKSIDNIRSEILDRYTSTPAQIFKKFYEDAGYSKLRNAVYGDQVNVYKNLFELDENGENTFVFKNPYDPNNNLKSYERDFLKKILFEMYKIRCAMKHITPDITGPDDQKLLTNMPRTYLYVPLQKAANASKRAHLKNNLVQFGHKIHRTITHPAEMLDEAAGYLDNQDIEERDTAIEHLRVYNPYTRSELSIRERDMYVSSKGAGFFETNLENIFIDFLSAQVKCDEFNKLATRIKGIELALTLKGEAEGDSASARHTIKAIDDFVTENIYNKSIMEGTSKKIDTLLQPLRSFVSKLYIAASPVAAVRDTLQGLQENFVQTLIKYQTDIDAKDVAFGYQQVFKDGCTNLAKMSLLNQFNIKYGFSNFDAAQVAERLKSGRGGVLNADNWAYWTLRAPDYLNRMTLFVAKLHHDGAFDAYSLDKDGRLVYNWRKDKRFSVYASGNTADPKYKEQRALYYSLIRAFNIENSSLQLSYTDDLPDAYTPAQIRAIKTLGESIYGAYDKSSKAKYEQVAIGRNFAFFSTWLNGLTDTYFKSRQVSQSELRLEQETDYNGNPLFFTNDESGNMTTVDTGLPVYRYVPVMVQGIYQTFKESFKELQGDGWNFNKFFRSDTFNNTVNRRNYKRAMTDLLIAALLTTLFKLFLTPAYKKHKAEADGKDFVTNAVIEIMYKSSMSSFDTFKGPVAILSYLGESTNPATYKVQSKVMKDTYNVLVGNKTLPQTIMNGQAFFRSMQDSYKMYLRDTNPS